ncbi:hypothetical protein N7474_000288 [Penicillium riverlandense]|uniref:uncharacterized protein n=1 Tax=Penicillium riverlandense TaxID=1903569 RepID=UPI0025466407|nr:uncharacterized protein N7474_000288 [Penicillium riverlandense]KAJ5831977.1 hypothetical protein N7474_000288 [Penicillium riverlandense]
MDEHPWPIPAYYCCYLLRSTVRHASLYIGSTPSPSRRLSQHNGQAKGGAKRTARDKLRPWEMVLVVEGFMSRVGALQFEWAWQHPDRSRHIDSDDEDKIIVDPKTGKPKSRAARSRRSLTAHLEDMQALLRSAYFSSGPLRVRFFCADVYRIWRVWSDRVHKQLPANIQLILDGDCPVVPDDPRQDQRVGSIHNLSVDYTRLGEYLEKSTFLLDDAEDLRCSVCKSPVHPEAEQIVVCPRANCRGVGHILCLSTKFLDAAEPDRLIPSQGDCPTCRQVVQWPDMMRELSLRNRAEKEARAILKRKEKRERQAARGGSAEPSTKSRSQRAHDQPDHLDPEDPPLDDRWFEAVDPASESESEGRQKNKSAPSPSKLEIVIEDSEWDDAELVE